MPDDLPEVVSIFKEGEYDGELHEVASKQLSELVATPANKNLNVRTEVGTANEVGMELLRVAEHDDVDMIVIATHGTTGWRRIAFGSVARKVVEQAGCWSSAQESQIIPANLRHIRPFPECLPVDDFEGVEGWKPLLLVSGELLFPSLFLRIPPVTMLQASHMFFFISHMFWILARDKVIAQPEALTTGLEDLQKNPTGVVHGCEPHKTSPARSRCAARNGKCYGRFLSSLMSVTCSSAFFRKMSAETSGGKVVPCDFQ